ncbi:MAG: hypothetical protein GY754_24040 [bacterium]|nr:hypothetical protein [bacterium]
MIRQVCHRGLLVLLQENNPLPYYNLACASAVQGKKKQALQWLKKAVKKGYRDRYRVKTDPDLKGLQKTNEFKKIVKSIKM